MIAGFTGSQTGMTETQRAELHWFLALSDYTEFHHGDCIGADAEAHDIALSIGIPVFIHPPTNTSKRAYCQGAEKVYPDLDYLERNKMIVNLSDVLYAAPSGPEVVRSGTWSTVRYATKAKKLTFILGGDA